MKKWWLGPLCLSAAASIWGGMYVVSKVVLNTVPPWVLLEMRFVIGLCVLGAWAFLAREWKIDLRDVKQMALIGLIGYTGSIGLQFVGTHLSGASLGSLITSASPALISVFAWKLLRRKTRFSQRSGADHRNRRGDPCHRLSSRNRLFHLHRQSDLVWRRGHLGTLYRIEPGANAQIFFTRPRHFGQPVWRDCLPFPSAGGNGTPKE